MERLIGVNCENIVDFYSIKLGHPLLYDRDNGMIEEIVMEMRNLKICDIENKKWNGVFSYDLFALTIRDLNGVFVNRYYIDKRDNNYVKI